MILEISASQLSFGMQGDDVARVHQAVGGDIPVAEAASRVMEAGTIAVLRALHADLNLPTAGIVDTTTAESLTTRCRNHGHASNCTKQEPIRSRGGTR